MAKRGAAYIENRDGTVTFRGRKLLGSLVHGSTCPRCRRIVVHVDRYDAFACPLCDVWLEPTCEDPTCSFCSTRPESPWAASQPTDPRLDAVVARRTKDIRRKRESRRPKHRDRIPE